MIRVLGFVAGFLFLSSLSFAQGDMLMVKKKGRVVKTYFPGSVIDYNIGDGVQEAQIESMKADSLFLVQYQIQKRMSQFGTIVWDTVATYKTSIHYNEIVDLVKPKTHAFDLNTMGAGLFGGGALLTTGGLLTWVFAKKNSTYYARPAFVITSAALTGVGFLLLQSKSEKKWVIGKKYSLQYLDAK